jgi:STE24 endopeptidase
MSDSAQDRTLPATARKISKAREEGQVARSRDLGHFAALMAASLALVAVGTPWLLARFGGRWGIEGMADPSVLPALTIVISLVFFLGTPITNSMIRVQEQEADVFGLNAARAPDGFARISIKLSHYRKI